MSVLGFIVSPDNIYFFWNEDTFWNTCLLLTTFLYKRKLIEIYHYYENLYKCKHPISLFLTFSISLSQANPFVLSMALQITPWIISGLNPIIYFFLTRSIRQGFLSHMRKCLAGVFPHAMYFLSFIFVNSLNAQFYFQNSPCMFTDFYYFYVLSPL